ncbi:MAG: prepilin-type N-terminal cleavage/methylation domain-containing protein [Endomicrobia bacterium]|nr:prepilin-type N-terminal cleavage/methylation domain-containing protein [Endomicrobiia bacterium]MCL2507048.1 prepilin-type N-terminal cleavage/methylation domain-containing protein [Endomicrobiia bacterium]
MKKAKGFTLVELIIVLVIICVLTIIAVPMYKSNTRRAMATEGKALLALVNTAQKIHFAEHGSFLAVPETSVNTDLDIDARGNKYFTSFSVTVNSTSFAAATTGTGKASRISLSLTGNIAEQPVIKEAGY